MYLKRMNTLTQKYICTPIFIAALFRIAKIWKQPKCPSINEWIKKIWYIHTMEYFSTIKQKESLLFATTWMELQGIMLNEVSLDRERQILYSFTYMWNLENKTNKQNGNRLIDTENKLMISRWEGGWWGNWMKVVKR